ncbi:MAG: YhjD/YihY/BrkB family envelope integrity protein, partial [Allorhizobium sp.]
TLALWLVGALLFAYYLASFANYAATYAGLASIMIVLVFLYMVGAIFIIGAEFNAALMKFRVVPVKGAPEGGISNPDHGANI